MMPVVVMPMVPVVPVMMVPVVMMPVVPVTMVPMVMMMPADLFGLQAIDFVLSYDGGLHAIRALRQLGLFG